MSSNYRACLMELRFRAMLIYGVHVDMHAFIPSRRGADEPHTRTVPRLHSH